jgi:hypothetical protein
MVSPFRWVSTSMSRWLPIFLLLPGIAHAGLHYSGETFAPLPARSSGFLRDHRLLLNVARSKPTTPLRTRYLAEVERLRKRERLQADEAADLGALYLRLGEPAEALAVLRLAQRAEPGHFRLTANLASAHHRAGELALAAAHLEQAVKLAPPALRAAEMLHLRLVRQRLREREAGLDDLFGVKYDDPTSLRKLPADALAHLQQLVLWMPDDGRLLWQLAELIGINGDRATRAAILDGCVSEFEMRQPELLAARKEARALLQRDADRRPTREDHEKHGERFSMRSPRALITRAALDDLPPIDERGINPLIWEVLNETIVDRRGRPQFHRQLRRLEGLRVTVRGYMQPVGDGTDLNVFLLIENPVGCWYCENPELVQIVLVELPEGRNRRLTREPLTVTGKLTLNATDPENFFFTLQAEKIVVAPSE